MKNLFLTILFASVSLLSFGQTKEDLDYLIFEETGDTVYCFITRIDRSSLGLNLVKYIDLNKQEHTLKSKQVDEVRTIKVGPYFLDYIPMNAEKDKYERHIERKISGKIIYYDYIRLTCDFDEKKGERNFYRTVGSGGPVHTVKLPNGEYYKLSKGNLSKYIVPYMGRCKEFRKDYNGGAVTKENFEEALISYNENCEE